MKTISLYIVILLGIPNILGLLIGFPLSILLAAIPRLIRPHTPVSSPLIVVPVGLAMGIGCGVVGFLAARILGQTPGIAVPVISSAWALFYYYSRGQSILEAWSNVVGVFTTWAGYWLSRAA